MESSADPNAELAALIGSRICHDLISPIGAISNGLELMGLGGGTDGAEIALIEQSCRNATARIRFFRVAFGAAPEGQDMARGEPGRILDEMGKGGRVRAEWRPDGPLPRAEVRLAFLAYLCFETALPRGGSVRFDFDGARWNIATGAARRRVDMGLWRLLEAQAPDPEAEITPAQVQFRMLADLAGQAGRRIRVENGKDRLGLTL